jgi:DNA-binding NtrC family response regulator
MPDNSKKILIIDDETDLCLLLKDYFTKKKYEVIVSHSLSEGVSVLKAQRPKVLFLDYNLPDGIGWELAPGIAKDFPNTYLVLISAFHSAVPEMPVGAQFRIIEKPITMFDLNKQFADL